jgi:hypothetical protein
MSKAVTKEQRELVEEFLAIYNELDSELRRRRGSLNRYILIYSGGGKESLVLRRSRRPFPEG